MDHDELLSASRGANNLLTIHRTTPTTARLFISVDERTAKVVFKYVQENVEAMLEIFCELQARGMLLGTSTEVIYNERDVDGSNEATTTHLFLFTPRHKKSTDIDGILSLASTAVLQDVKLPSNMEQIVHAQMDELEDEPKLFLAVTSVFHLPLSAETLFEVLHHVQHNATATKTTKEVAKMMNDLCELGYLSKEAEALGAAHKNVLHVYSFKSAVIGRAVYTSMPPELRRNYHAGVAAWFVEQFGEDLQTSKSSLGNLYTSLARHKELAADAAGAAEFYFLGAISAANSELWEEGELFGLG